MENGFDQLALDYMEYQEMFKTYQTIPSDKRYEYREQNPETDANLFFWGYVTTLQSAKARLLVKQMIDRYHIPVSAIKGYDKVFKATPEAVQPTPQPAPKLPYSRSRRTYSSAGGATRPPTTSEEPSTKPEIWEWWE